MSQISLLKENVISVWKMQNKNELFKASKNSRTFLNRTFSQYQL